MLRGFGKGHTHIRAGCAFVAAAAELGGDPGGVVAGDGADGELGLTGGGFPQGRGHPNSRHRPGEIGDVVHIVLGDPDFLLHLPGNHGEGQGAVLQQLHMLHDPALNPQTPQGIGLEQLLVQLIEPCSRPGALGRRGEGVLRGVGEPEAARVRGKPHVHRLGKPFLHGYSQDFQNIPHQLRAGGAVRVHDLPGGEGGGGSVVVDAKLHPIQQRREGIGQHSRGGHVHGDGNVPLLRFLPGQPLMEEGEPGGDLRVLENMAGFAQAPQPQAQRGGAAQGVPVGTAVGQQQVMVMAGEKFRRLSPRQLRHGSPPES